GRHETDVHHCRQKRSARAHQRKRSNCRCREGQRRSPLVPRWQRRGSRLLEAQEYRFPVLRDRAFHSDLPVELIGDVLIRVAVPIPQLDLLTYRVPDGTPHPSVGARVVVPLGSRIVTGIVGAGHASMALADTDVKPIRQLLDTGPFVPADVVELAKWTSEYYMAGPGETLTAVLPPATRGQRAEAH